MYELHTSELLPEVLPAICFSFHKAAAEGTDWAGAVISQNRVRISEIITTTFVEKEDQAKCRVQLSAAFESFLDFLVEFNVEMVAVILDKYRPH